MMVDMVGVVGVGVLFVVVVGVGVGGCVVLC